MQRNLFAQQNNRIIFSLIVLASFSSVGFAIFSQYYNNVEPCPLCIVQRIIYLIAGLVALIAFFHKPQCFISRIYAVILVAIGLFGIKIAYHHVWLQSLPPEQWPASCGMPLSILYKQIPLSGFIHTVLSGTAECAMVNWKILGINGPTISMYGFIMITILAVYPVVAKKNN